MSTSEHFAKANEKLEQPKHNFQTAYQKSISEDEELRINSLVPPQQSSGWEHETTKQLFKTSAPLLLKKEVAINNTAKLVNFLLILTTDS